MTITVIALLGYGRSGSTLLDVLLGQHPNVAGVGELVQLHREGWQLNNYCACGARAGDCSFWAEVRRLWTARSGMESVEAEIDPPAPWNAIDSALRARACDTVATARGRLARRFRELPDEDLAVAGVVLTARKPA